MEQAKRRRPVIAFLLSFVMPGLGQLYNGNLGRGILMCVGLWATFMVLLGLTRWIYSIPALICIAAVIIITSILVATDAAIGAARLKAIHVKWYNKWYLYVGVLLFGCYVLTPAIAWITKNHIVGVRTFKVPARSMEPLLMPGDHFVAKLERFDGRLPARGDVIIFPFPEDTSKDFVKRVVGLPGERLEIKDKVVLINGQRIEDPWGFVFSKVTFPARISPRDNFGPITMPQGAVFVMGDNRDYSHDSRFWGPVETKDIKAKPLFIYWSDDKSRIGKQLQ